MCTNGKMYKNLQFRFTLLSQYCMYSFQLHIFILQSNIIMGKTSDVGESPIKKNKAANPQKKKFGRPSNIGIQTSFMNIIRGTKLQTINAQSQLQLQITFFTAQDQKKNNSRRQQPSHEQNTPKILQFVSLTHQEKVGLVQLFQRQKKNWSFDEIQTEHQIPKYFFDDGDDLSFILYRILVLKQQTLEKIKINYKEQLHSEVWSTLKAQQLFFMSLLCLNSRQNLRYVVLEFFLKNQVLIVNLIKAAMEKIRIKYREKIRKQKQQMEKLGQQGEARTNKFKQITQQQIYEDSSLMKQKSLSKKIQKNFKPSKKLNKLESSDEQQAPMMSQKDKQDKLIYCLVSYISWSYFYIYSEEQKLQKLQRKE